MPGSARRPRLRAAEGRGNETCRETAGDRGGALLGDLPCRTADRLERLGRTAAAKRSTSPSSHIGTSEMTRAETCIARVLTTEGGYSNNPRDRGGPTNKGITLATFRKFVQPGASIENLKALTDGQATIVYKRQFWDPIVASSLPIGIDYVTFDFAVNSGPDRAVHFLQAAIGAKPDGVVGPKTIAAARTSDPSTVIASISNARLSWMRSLEDWDEFGGGWKARVARVELQALADAKRFEEPLRGKGAGVATN
ncbi:hypothetical protein FGG78_20985 [Thioclava sp. BHET1]|nr:hypothetical protein FGG78_20985 [Thioclava sp. BHET1]